MAYAIKNGGAWRELPVGADIVIDDVATSYATMLAWTPLFRTGRGVKEVEEAPIPAGKVAVGSTLVDRSGKPTRTYELADSAAPVAAVPEAITMRQAKLMLHRAGLLPGIEQQIAAMPGDDGKEARIEWQTASVLERNHPLVTIMGVPDQQVDSLFTWAAAL